MIWYRDKAITLVEFHGILILGLDDDSHGCYHPRRLQCLTKGVHQQDFTNGLALEITMTRQTADERSGKARVFWNFELLEEFLRYVAGVHSVLGQCVITRDGYPIRR